jgi:Exopolysaccharide biosynthesis protein YbjH
MRTGSAEQSYLQHPAVNLLIGYSFLSMSYKSYLFASETSCLPHQPPHTPLQQQPALRRILWCASSMLCLAALPAWALDEAWPGQAVPYTPAYTDFGGTGLFQMPSARMQPDGQFHLGVSNIKPYRRLFLNLQGLPWLEAGFRLTQITNRIEPGSLAFEEAQSFYDRGIDLKLRLLEEGPNTPALALGFRDLGGTNLFASEYLVASRRYYNLDFTFGAAWGNMGSRGGIENPLTWLSDRFADRNGDASAGSINLNRFFSGSEIALFGGIEAMTPVEGLRLVVEYDANSYQQEPLGNVFEVASPLNAGVKYTPSDWLQLAAGVERGNNVMLRLSLTQSLTRRGSLDKVDPAPPALGHRPAALPVAGTFAPQELQTPCTAAQAATARTELVRIDGTTYHLHLYTPVCRLSDSALRQSVRMTMYGFETLAQNYSITLIAEATVLGTAAVPADTRQDLAALLYPKIINQYIQNSQQESVLKSEFAKSLPERFASEGYTLEGTTVRDDTLTVWVRQGRYRDMPRAFGRAARIAAATAPANIEHIHIVLMEKGLPVLETAFVRRDIEQGASPQRLSAAETAHRTTIAAPQEPLRQADFVNDSLYPDLDLGLNPGFRQSFGGPDAYYVFQVYAEASATLTLTPGLMLDGRYSINLYNTFDELKLPSDSQLPRVRTDISRYLKQGDTGLNQLDMNYLFPVATNWYGKASAGIFELMFGGAGGEVLYAPAGRPWAVGGEFYWVKQRDFDAGFAFVPYETTTGHFSLYYDLPFNGMTGKIHAGRYLAGDDGATFELSRSFDSGVELGVFATLTDVSAEKFGEGSFDKGFYISFPFDMFTITSSRARRSFVFRPTTRDGGQRIGTSYRLYDTVKEYRQRNMQGNWRDVWR